MHPSRIIKKWLGMARRLDLVKAEAFCLSTVDTDANVSSRMLLTVDIDNQGIVFCTDSRTKKVSNLEACSKAAALYYWPSLGRQIKMEGRIEVLDDRIAEADFSSKSLAEQISLTCSQQSSVIENFHQLRRRFNSAASSCAPLITRPPNWKAYLLNLEYVEFFLVTPHKLNKRLAFKKREKAQWQRLHLAP